MEENTIGNEETIDGQTIIGEEKSEAIAHKDGALKRLDTSFNKHIELKEYKKSNLLAYWIKDFANYHDEERTFSPTSLKYFKRGDIVKANLGFNIGKELGGLHYCVVINSNDNVNSGNLNVVPLSSIKENKTYNSSTCVNLGNELYSLLTRKYNTQLSVAVKEFNNLQSVKNMTTDEVLNLSRKIKYLKKLEEELNKMKQGSIAYVHQITTISKQRIFKTPILSGIKLSSSSLNKLDDKIIELFTKKN